MAHCFHSGVFYNNQNAWHNLGIVKDTPEPARIAFASAKADFTVLRHPIYRSTEADDDSDSFEAEVIPGFSVLQRNDNGAALHVATSTYEVIQTESMISLLEVLHEDIEMDSVVVLDEGRRVAASAKILDCSGDVLPGDTVETHLTVANSFNGTISFSVLFSPFRVECSNMLAAAMHYAENTNRILRIKHTKGAKALIERIPAAIDLQRRSITTQVEALQAMAATPCLSSQFRDYCQNVFATQLAGTVNDVRGDDTTARPKTLDDLPYWGNLQRLYDDGIGFDIPGVRGSYWGAYQAISQFLTHEAGRTKDPVEASRARLESLYWGSAGATLTRANDIALAATRS
jgi:phage/plasmid-like protein (TIGR03299 family)